MSDDSHVKAVVNVNAEDAGKPVQVSVTSTPAHDSANNIPQEPETPPVQEPAVQPAAAAASPTTLPPLVQSAEPEYVPDDDTVSMSSGMEDVKKRKKVKIVPKALKKALSRSLSGFSTRKSGEMNGLPAAGGDNDLQPQASGDSTTARKFSDFLRRSFSINKDTDGALQ